MNYTRMRIGAKHFCFRIYVKYERNDVPIMTNHVISILVAPRKRDVTSIGVSCFLHSLIWQGITDGGLILHYK